MKITIVTAVYNRAETLSGALASVARQTYRDVEHLIIDGKSNDNTLAVIEAARHTGMRVVSEADAGIYDALNKGFALATGDVVGLVHSDDFLAHDRVLEQIMAAFADPAIDAVYGDLDYVAAANPDKVIRRWQAGIFSPAKLRRGWMPPHPALFIRRCVWEQYGDYDTRYRIAGDYDAVLRWFGQGQIRVVYIPEVLVKMRTGGESNRSLGRIIAKSREDYRALRTNKVGGLGALILKNVSKLSQFVAR
jgi:glycosyltransferase involved in cell wall biosynthesis